MKALLSSLVLVLALLPPCISASDYPSFDHAPRLTLYFHINFGNAGKPSQVERYIAAPRFGLSLDRDLPYRFSVDNDAFAGQALQSQSIGLRKSVSMFDLQFALDGAALPTQTLNVGGATMLSSDGSKPSAWKNPWVWVGIGVGILAISCATDNFPCESNDNNGMGGGSGY